ncbi:hypothetical protein CIW50_25350 [Tardiphaga sp. P9-11]|jgi:hypothetical protein|nr:hypothetical protein CIW50_25350 [Tardiphaga sp. P9-11]
MLLTAPGARCQSLSKGIEAAIPYYKTSLEMMMGKAAGRISIGAVSTSKNFVKLSRRLLPSEASCVAWHAARPAGHQHTVHGEGEGACLPLRATLLRQSIL